MGDHGYESGRLNLPFVGHSTFMKSPPVTDWDAIDAWPESIAAELRSGDLAEAAGAQ